MEPWKKTVRLQSQSERAKYRRQRGAKAFRVLKIEIPTKTLGIKYRGRINENTNDLSRFYFFKGTDFLQITDKRSKE